MKTEATTEWEERLGAQIRRARLSQDIDQVSLARRANVSINTVRSLESGDGGRITSLVRVLRALGLEDWLDTLAPPPEMGPLDRLRGLDAPDEPTRASRKARD